MSQFIELDIHSAKYNEALECYAWNGLEAEYPFKYIIVSSVDKTMTYAVTDLGASNELTIYVVNSLNPINPIQNPYYLYSTINGNDIKWENLYLSPNGQFILHIINGWVISLDIHNRREYDYDFENTPYICESWHYIISRVKLVTPRDNNFKLYVEYEDEVEFDPTIRLPDIEFIFYYKCQILHQLTKNS